MQQTRLVKLLGTFSAREIKRFIQFTESPYFNKNEKVRMVCIELAAYYPDFNKLPGEEKFYKKATGKNDYSYSTFKNITSDILQLALQFIEIENLETNAYLGSHALLESLYDRKQDKLFEKELQRAHTAFHTLEKPGEAPYFEKYLVSHHEMNYRTRDEPNVNLEFVQYSYDAFLELYLLKMLDFYGLLMHEKMQNNIAAELHLFEPVINYVNKNYDRLNTTSKVYADMIHLMQDLTNVEYYTNLKNMLRINHDKIPFDLLERGYVHLVDFCAIQINRLGNNEYVREVHNLHKDILQFNIQTIGNMAYQDFLNVVKIAAVIKEFEWVEKFIQEHGPHIAENERENSLQFSYAIVAYYKEDFAGAIRHMSSVNFKDPIMKIQVKSNTIRYLYEEKLYEQTFASIDAFSHYLRREKMLTDEIISSHEQFIGYVKEMIKIELEPDKKAKSQLKTALTDKVLRMQTNYFGTKNWLKKKLGIAYQKAV